ncbi:SCO4225 family membrane protein [Streptomyces sp. NPDC060232]|uniref:SCO4225 family membrane protein n=1 Tax=Streptomyces sp. NPDC060232 TaxID=3347079 RepID=UPI003667B6B7
MRSGPVRTFAVLTFGNWLSGAYLGLAAFLLLTGAGDGGDQTTGIFALMLAVPTGALLLSVVNSMGSWAQTDATIWCILACSYLFQAFLLGLVARASRRRRDVSGEVRASQMRPGRSSATLAVGDEP